MSVNRTHAKGHFFANPYIQAKYLTKRTDCKKNICFLNLRMKEGEYAGGGGRRVYCKEASFGLKKVSLKSILAIRSENRALKGVG
jgi:hypothetical protein